VSPTGGCVRCTASVSTATKRTGWHERVAGRTRAEEKGLAGHPSQEQAQEYARETLVHLPWLTGAWVVFGVDLQVLCKQRSKFVTVPDQSDVIVKCCEYVEKFISEEGIYRQSGNSYQVDDLRHEFEKTCAFLTKLKVGVGVC
jgi:hypothetical protein